MIHKTPEPFYDSVNIFPGKKPEKSQSYIELITKVCILVLISNNIRILAVPLHLVAL